jgi:hypothetical protein
VEGRGWASQNTSLPQISREELCPLLPFFLKKKKKNEKEKKKDSYMTLFSTIWRDFLGISSTLKFECI